MLRKTFFDIVMYRYSIIVVFALCVAAYSQTAGAQPIALKQAESEAVSNNISLLAQKYEISAAEADIVTAHILPNNPYLVLYGDILPTGGSYSVDNKYWGGSVVFPIELGGKRDASVAVAENNKEVTTAAFEDAVRTLILTVRTSFYDALAAKANLQLATEDQTALDSVVALNRIRVQAKDIPESDLMRSEIAVEQTRVDLQSAQIDYEKARFNLQIAMGRKNLSPDFDIMGDLTTLPDPPALSLEEAKQAAHEHRPDLKSLQDLLAT
ncbi:MAG TPA: TolC family protein, partial [Candidatus Kapabacteria bacterium]|nr:TolC family protein [Candidatus Kapabacteria bacterium]